MDSELLLKFIEYFPDYLSALSRTLLRSFWTTFIETAVFRMPETEVRVLAADHVFTKYIIRCFFYTFTC